MKSLWRARPDTTIGEMTRATSRVIAPPDIVSERLGTMVVAATGLFACAGCWTSARSSAPASGADGSLSNVSASNTGGEHVVVRMANKDELEVPSPPSPPPGHARRMNTLGNSCPKSGPSVRAYYKPVVAFAREHFLGDEHGEVHESLIVADTDKPRLGDGVNIVVEPRGAIGELRVVRVGPPRQATVFAFCSRARG